MTPQPPKWADRFLQFVLSRDNAEEIAGDLHEAFHWRVGEKGPRKARLLFVTEALISIKISNLKPIAAMNNYLMMYRNYFKSGWRFMLKNKFYSILNILGLAFGISFCWLAYLYTNNELSYNRHLQDHSRLFRVVIDFKTGNEIHYIGGTSNAMSVQFGEKIPEIETVARVDADYAMVHKEEGAFGQRFNVMDHSLLDLLELEFLEGSSGGFDDPNEVIISESLAGKLNLRGRAVGTSLPVTKGETTKDFIIRGVFRNIPENTSVRSDMIVPFAYYVSSVPPRRLTTWFDLNMNAIVQLHEAEDKAVVERKMNDLQDENNPEEDAEVTIRLQPFSEMHLSEKYGHYNGIAPGGNPDLVWLFSGIGLVCLLISIINYANFNVSLSIGRAREMGLRKVIGAKTHGIFSQLVTESFLSSGIAGALAVIIMLVILPHFSSFVGKAYDISVLLQGSFVPGAGAILVVVAFASGIYPATVLSRFSVTSSLRGDQKTVGSKWITQFLLAVQFLIASVFIAGMFTMRNQIGYLVNFDKKLDPTNVLFLQLNQTSDLQVERFVQQVEQIASVDQAAASSGYNGTRITTEKTEFDVRHMRMKNDLIDLLKINVLKGRNFDPAHRSDESSSVLVNQELVEKMGLTSPIGQTLPFSYNKLEDPTIVGVIDNYVFESARQKVEPLVVYTSPEYDLQEVYIRLKPGATFDPSDFEVIWNTHFSPYPFDYRFLEDEYENLYRSEQQMLRLVGIGCFVSIFLAGLGLMGIVGIQLNKKLREISIRKVLGASDSNLYNAFTTKFVLVIIPGLAFGIGIGYHLIVAWLSQYPNRVAFGVETMALTVGLTLAIAVITILCQVMRVIRTNPVKYLKDE